MWHLKVCGKWTGAGVCETGLEEGCLELASVKEISVGPRDRENPDLSNTLRRYGLEGYHLNDVCLALVYGQNLSDNRILFLLSPPTLCRWVILVYPRTVDKSVVFTFGFWLVLLLVLLLLLWLGLLYGLPRKFEPSQLNHSAFIETLPPIRPINLRTQKPLQEIGPTKKGKKSLSLSTMYLVPT